MNTTALLTKALLSADAAEVLATAGAGAASAAANPAGGPAAISTSVTAKATGQLAFTYGDPVFGPVWRCRSLQRPQRWAVSPMSRSISPTAAVT